VPVSHPAFVEACNLHTAIAEAMAYSAGSVSGLRALLCRLAQTYAPGTSKADAELSSCGASQKFFIRKNTNEARRDRAKPATHNERGTEKGIASELERRAKHKSDSLPSN